MNWLDEAIKSAKSGEPAVLVTVAEVSGSSPREAGAKMLVSRHETIDTIGGGALELDAIKIAKADLEKNVVLKDYPLGPSLQQCCGGFVRIIFEPIDESSIGWLEAWLLATTNLNPSFFSSTIGKSQQKIMLDKTSDKTGLIENGNETIFIEKVCEERPVLWIFGAGHVAHALITALKPLNFNTTIVDTRAEFLEKIDDANVTVRNSEIPFHDVANIPSRAIVLVMTHSHALDFDICHAALERGDLTYVGLIGSGTKKARFLKRLREKGLNDGVIANLTCPIGVGDISNKQPAAIAISVAAQLLSLNSKQSIKNNQLTPKTIAN